MMKYISTTKRGHGQHGTITQSMREYRKMDTLKNLKKKKNGLDGNRKLKSNQWNSKKVMEKNEGTEDDLVTIQKDIETAAGMVAHHSKSEREKYYGVCQRISDYARKPRRGAQQRSRGEY